MARKMVEKFVEHPDTYRMVCGSCGRIFEAGNEDYSYLGGDVLACDCPWCGVRKTVRLRELRKAKIHYGASYEYVN